VPPTPSILRKLRRVDAFQSCSVLLTTKVLLPSDI
jgi:hypothetical protein